MSVECWIETLSDSLLSAALNTLGSVSKLRLLSQLLPLHPKVQWWSSLQPYGILSAGLMTVLSQYPEIHITKTSFSVGNIHTSVGEKIQATYI